MSQPRKKKRKPRGEAIDRLALRVQPALLAILRGTAEREGVKLAVVVRRALAAYAERPDLAAFDPPGRKHKSDTSDDE